MNETLIKEILARFYPLSGSTINEFLDMLEEMEVDGGIDFISKGHRDYHEYMVLDGICRSYLLNPEGMEVTISFFSGQEVLSPFITRTRNKISTLNYQALTPVKLVRFHAFDFEEFMVNNLEMRAWGNEVLKHELALKVEKEIELASHTARERLMHFRKRFPLLENLVPHSTISSYLGITNVSLSRLRKKISD